MKLSEAMMLGSTTCKMLPGDWNSCGLGCAGNAVGIPQTQINHCERFLLIGNYWPWLLGSHFPSNGGELATRIWKKFDNEVCEGKMTFEALVDYVRSIEPDCGECNQFQCTCQKQEAAQEQIAVTV